MFGAYGSIKNKKIKMIKETELEIFINNRNISYYKKLGYNVKNNSIINVKIEDINKNSKIKITAICEECGIENTINLEKYYKNEERQGYYGCKKCSRKKFRLTNIKNFGVDNPMKNAEIKNKVEENNLSKYGVKTTLLEDNTKEKIKNTLIEKYGIESPFLSKVIKEKSKITMNDRYGVDYPLQSKEIYNKLEKTVLSKYNVKHPMLLDEIKNKVKETNLKKYGNISPMKSKVIQQKIANKYKLKYNNINILNVYLKTLEIKCDTCDEIFTISKTLFNHKNADNVKLCPRCNPPTISTKEIEMQNFIHDNYNSIILYNDKTILPPYELDIYLPELKLAFEYNGVYWHNELNKEDNYHLNKTEECEKQGTQLIHIYEDDWLFKQNIIKSIILNKLGKTNIKIYARNCEIKEIKNNQLVKEFLDENHIQGHIGSKIKLGLFYKNELISLMTFGNRRIAMGKKFTNENEYKLLRFCNKLNVSVIGGASKLFKYFTNNYKSNKITTYADRSISNGNLYKILGFNFIKKTKPNYYYVINKKRVHRFNFRKDILIKEGYDKNKTEHEIMLERKIYRIYDAGNLKFEFKKK